MTPEDLFGVAIRTTGFWIVLYGTYTLIVAMSWFYAASVAATANKSDDMGNVQPGYKYLFIGIVEVFMGVAVISVADQIVSMSY